MYTHMCIYNIFPTSFSNHFVRVWYLNNNTIDGFDLTNTTLLLNPMSIPGCDKEICPLDQFIM